MPEPTDVRRLVLALIVAGSVPLWSIAAQSAGAEAPFLAETAAAMTRMMDAMAIRPSGQVDADFAAMMIPHHQGAIDMAEAELRFGHNEQLRRIAQEIVVEQQQEIVAMRLALARPLPPSEAAPTTAAPDRSAETTGQAAAPMSTGSMHMKTETPQ